MDNKPREFSIKMNPNIPGEGWIYEMHKPPENSPTGLQVIEKSAYDKAMEERQHFWSICVKRAEEVKALKQKLEEHADSINCIMCGSLGEIVVEDFTARGVTIKAAYRKCTKCDMTWLTGKQEHTIDKRIIETLDDARSHWQAKAIELEKQLKQIKEIVGQFGQALDKLEEK